MGATVLHDRLLLIERVKLEEGEVTESTGRSSLEAALVPRKRGYRLRFD